VLRGRDGKMHGEATAESKEMFRTMGRREVLKYVVDGSSGVVSVKVSMSPPQVLRHTMHRRA
jgi:hypothetical protein